MGLIGAGTNNARLAAMLRQVGFFCFYMRSGQAFVGRFSAFLENGLLELMENSVPSQVVKQSFSSHLLKTSIFEELYTQNVP